MIGTMQRSLGILVTILFLILTFAFTAMATDISLQWDPNTESDLAGYRVYQGKGAELGTFKKIQEIAAPTTSATVTGLDNTSHSFVVTAYNSAGLESAYSNIVIIPAAPAVPGNLKWTITLTMTGKVE